MNNIQNTGNRDYLLDSLRGLMLVLMLLDHDPYFFSYTFQPLGFFSAAEGFFYLSGFVYGMVYYRYVDDPAKLWNKSISRIRKMYIFHVTIFFVLFVEAILLRYGFKHDLAGSWTAMEANLAPNILRFFCLLYYPYLFNIIPIYIIFFFLGPIVLKCYKQKKAWLVLTVSLGLWSWSLYSTNPFHYLQLISSHVSSELSTFNPISWQIVFILGIYFGIRRIRKQKLPDSKILLYVAISLCIVLFILRRIPAAFQINMIHESADAIGRSLVVPLRLLNFLSFAYILAILTQHVKLSRKNYFAFLGSYSINVFIFHIFIIYNLIKLTNTLDQLPSVIQFILVFCCMWSLTIPAFIAENIKKKHPLLFQWKEYLSLFPREFILLGKTIFSKFGIFIHYFSRKSTT